MLDWGFYTPMSSPYQKQHTKSSGNVILSKSLSWSYLAYFVLKNNFTRLGESLVWLLNLGIFRSLILKQEVVLSLWNFYFHKKASPLSAVSFSGMTQSHVGCLAEMFRCLFSRLNASLATIYWIYCLDCERPLKRRLKIFYAKFSFQHLLSSIFV